ncbi:MAG TPA: FG-GAP repeat protein, partial [Rhodanobacteraceae bacterium]|nr:FG-GAP repeat protein [Rhodanobacteraceae bacterium]
MSHRMAFSEFRFVVAASFALALIAAFDPVTVQARAAAAAGLPSIVHATAGDALSSASAHAISGLAFDDALAPEGSVWSGQKVVVDGAQGDFFGWSVAIDGPTALVGAYGVTSNGQEQQGAVYVFTQSNGIWTQTATLTANDGHAFDIFGSEVSISGTVAAIGAYQYNHSHGVVYVFTGSGSSWTQKAELVADDGAANDCLGWSVAVANGTVLAGAPFAIVDGLQRGAVYSFAPIGGVWAQTQKVTASDGALGDFFGDAVAMDGSIAVIGADSVTVNGNQVQGAAYVFDSSASTWTQKIKLTSDDGAAFDNFGRSVAVSGSTVWVGTPYAVVNGNAFQGAVYVYEGSGADWGQTQKLTAGDGAANDFFGWSVAVSGTNAMVGANSYNDNNPGEIYAFNKSASGWSQTQQFGSG